MEKRISDIITISIIMPACNAEETIRTAIQSVLEQTYTHWELIVVDDASEDSTAVIVEKLIKSHSDKIIRLLSNDKNLGAAEARNRGIREARGEWIAFLDSDDLWHPEKLRKQTELLKQRENADIIYTGSSFIQYDGSRQAWQMRVPESVTYRQLLKQNVIACSSVLIKRELVLRYPMTQKGRYGEMHEDYPVWLQVLKNGGHAYGLNEPLLIYRLSKSSRSGNKIKAAVMTYHVYRYIDLSWYEILYCFTGYVYRNLRKYSHLYIKE